MAPFDIMNGICDLFRGVEFESNIVKNKKDLLKQKFPIRKEFILNSDNSVFMETLYYIILFTEFYFLIKFFPISVEV